MGVFVVRPPICRISCASALVSVVCKCVCEIVLEKASLGQYAKY